MKKSAARGQGRIVRWAVALAFLLSGATACRTALAQGEKKAAVPPTADRIDFSIHVAPGDPFSEGNKVGAVLKEARPGEVLQLTITGAPKPGYHTYPLTFRAPDQKAGQLSSLTFEKSDVFQPLWPVAETAPEFVDEEGSGVLLEHEHRFTWTVDVLVSPKAKPGPANLRFTAKVQVCNNSCVWGDHVFDVPLTVLSVPPESLPTDVQQRMNRTPPPPTILPIPASGVKKKGAGAPEADGVSRAGGSGLLGFILQGALWGAISLVTPCVFPMIPITVSFFIHQSEAEHHRPVVMASIYCATIIVVLTISAVALLSLFQKVSTHPFTNYAMGALFIFFALSLFGMYEIELPSSLAAFTSKREGQGGVVGTIFMALTFTIISFACVAPFLGGFGGTAAASGLGLSWAHRIFGGLAFSTAFASPFFVLALFPSLLRKMPRPGTWLNSVKVVMGFLELAAALKFIRAGELAWLSESTYFTYDVVLGLYVAIALLCGLYLLNLYRLPHDTPIDNLGVPRMLFGLAFLGLTVYLVPGLFKVNDKGTNARPTGVVFAWIDAFLLSDSHGELTWERSFDKGLEEARLKRQLVLVDFTGVTCTNCAYNENNVFIKPAAKELLLKYVRVQLYTDRVPNKLYSDEELQQFGGSVARQKEEAAENGNLQSEKFNNTQLPLYIILQPLGDGQFKEVARYAEGKINDPGAFIAFLRKPLRSTGK